MKRLVTCRVLRPVQASVTWNHPAHERREATALHCCLLVRRHIDKRPQEDARCRSARESGEPWTRGEKQEQTDSLPRESNCPAEAVPAGCFAAAPSGTGGHILQWEATSQGALSVACLSLLMPVPTSHLMYFPSSMLWTSVTERSEPAKAETAEPTTATIMPSCRASERAAPLRHLLTLGLYCI